MKFKELGEFLELLKLPSAFDKNFTFVLLDITQEELEKLSVLLETEKSWKKEDKLLMLLEECFRVYVPDFEFYVKQEIEFPEDQNKQGLFLR